jgi:hypothetical protein
MLSSVATSTRITIAENSIAAAVFLFLLAAQSLAYLLYCYPGSELLWALSVPFNRLAAPVLDPLDAWLGVGPLTSIAMLGAVAAAPVLAHLGRNWLGTSVSGHVALAVSVVLTAGAMQRAQTHQVSASLAPIFDPSAFDMSSTGLALATAALVVLCGLNHIVFFVRARAS